MTIDLQMTIENMEAAGMSADDIVRLNENRLNVQEGDEDHSRLALPNASE